MTAEQVAKFDDISTEELRKDLADSVRDAVRQKQLAGAYATIARAEFNANNARIAQVKADYWHGAYSAELGVQHTIKQLLAMRGAAASVPEVSSGQ
jgi:hypothetical protein